MKLKIGDISIKNNLVMAPMAGITDMPFRLLAKNGGAGLVCSEMISACALAHNDKKTLKLLELCDQERPVSVQIFGSKPEEIKEASKIVENQGADILDINFGCPAPKIKRSGSGSQLLANIAQLSRLIESALSAVKIPVTAKIRIGINEGENFAPAIVEAAGKLGIAAITIHARSSVSLHKGDPNLAAIKEAVLSSKVPIIANGGIIDEVSAKKFVDETGCDGLMIGRAAIGDYKIFERIAHFLETGNILQQEPWEEKLKTFKKHAEMSVSHYGPKIGIVILRKTAPYYFKGLPNASRMRELFNKITLLDELDEVLKNLWISPYFE